MKRRSRYITAFLLLAFMWLPPAFSQDASQEEVYRLANQVQKRILRLSNYGVFDEINFAIGPAADGGYEVVLSGSASRPTLQKSAQRQIERIEGVSSVQNDIEVLPNNSGDERVRLAVYANIYGHPVLSRYNPNRGAPAMGMRQTLTMGISTNPPMGPHPIHIIVNAGNVRLIGVVDTEGDKTIAAIQANTVSGVFSVTDEIEFRQSKKSKK